MSIAQRISELATAIGTYIKTNVNPRLLPEGGVDGQLLTKTTDGYNWVDAPAQATTTGFTGTFTTHDGKTVTITDGVVTDVVEPTAAPGYSDSPDVANDSQPETTPVSEPEATESAAAEPTATESEPAPEGSPQS